MPGSCSKPTAASSVTPNGGPFSPRPAYRWACEVSVYLERDRRRTGGGRALYGALFARLAGAGSALPWHGAWHDVAWTQRTITTGEDPPAEPR